MKKAIKSSRTWGLIIMMMLGAAGIQDAGAQEYVAPAVTVSKDKVKIDGKIFYSHIVLEKQTLFSISKAYNVTIDEIHQYNPSVKENGLRKNDILIIPATPAQKEQTHKEQTRNHQVEQAPVQYEHAQEVSMDNGAIYYIVNWYDDLSSIAAKFNVSEEEILAANGLKSRKLKNKQRLVIPAADENPVKINTVPDEQENNETGENIDETDISDEQYSWDFFAEGEAISDLWFNIEDKPKVCISVVLPFKADGRSASKNNMDFYSGVLLAARDITDNNIDLELNVIDIASEINEIDVDCLAESDVIIGPILSKDISNIQTITGGRCPIVSPLDQRVENLATKGRNLIQAPTSQYAQFSDVANWIKEDLKENDRVIVISEKGARQGDSGRSIISVISSKGIEYTPISYSILEGRNIQHTLESKMTVTGVNRVVVASESEAFVNDAVRNLNLTIHNKYNVVLYSPAKIRTFETIEIDNLHNISLHVSLSYNIDYNDEETIAFLGKYRAMFGTEPTQFAFQGYDLTRYFAELIAKDKDNWTSILDDETTELLQSNVRFRSTDSGSYINHGTRRAVYGKGYAITPIKISHSLQPEE